jgi:hypothetical protein
MFHNIVIPFCTLAFTSTQNKVIFNYFPYPWFVSSVHVVVGAAYCILAYLIGAKKASFERVCLLLGLLVGRLAGPE